MKHFRIIFVALATISALFIAACTPGDSGLMLSDFDHVCSAEERDVAVCTLEYNPVCGSDGKTYGNGCAACANADVSGWYQGECETNENMNEVSDFESCVAAGNLVMESYPRQCAHDGTTYVEDLSHQCSADEKENLACTREYDPVCGDDGNTYSNGCMACGSGGIDSWTPGECASDGVIETFNVGPTYEDCVGVAPQKCLIVDGKYFYDSIEGFEYKEGYNYVLEVKKIERTDVPADASKYSYELVNIVSRTPAFEQEMSPCTREYMPVCGEVEVQCVRAPCDPVKVTFSNMCEAENADAMNIVDGACEDETVNPEGACLSFDGRWLEESKECEGMAQEQCESLGGTHNECASACRNNPDADVCTLQCVMVCQFE